MSIMNTENAKKRYGNVQELIKDLDIPADVKKQIAEEVETHSLSTFLIKLRAMKDLSQKQLAEKMKRTQSYVSKLENKKNDAITFGDLRNYMNALDLMFVLNALPQKGGLAGLIRQSLYNIEGYLDELVKICGDDRDMKKGVQAFHKQCLGYLEKCIAGNMERLAIPPVSSITLPQLLPARSAAKLRPSVEDVVSCQ